jgi:hypothetical protein
MSPSGDADRRKCWTVGPLISGERSRDLGDEILGRG